MGRVYTTKFVKGTRVYEARTDGPQIERIVKDEVENTDQRSVIQELIARQKEFYKNLTQK